jgi:hypothetical protein
MTDLRDRSSLDQLHGDARMPGGQIWVHNALEKVGLHVPTTVAEVEAVAKAFVKAQLGGLTTYGLNVAASGGTAAFST